MMTQSRITKEELSRVAMIARLSLTEEEKEEFTRDAAQILDHFEKIATLPNTEEFLYLHQHTVPLRPDTAKKASNADEIVSQFSRSEDRFEKVPKNL